MNRKTLWITGLFLSLCLGSILHQSAAAADPQPKWVQNLNCNPAEQKYQGLEYCTWKDPDTGVYSHVIVIDLTSTGIKLEYVIAEGKNRSGKPVECRDVNIPSVSTKGDGCRDVDNEYYYPILSLTDAVARVPDAAAVINTDYGAGDQGKEGEYRGHGPEGLAIIQRTRIDGPVVGDYDKYGSTDPNTNNAVRRPWLLVGEQGPLQSKVKISQIPQDHDDGGNPEPWAYTGVGGGPWLVKDGDVQKDDIANCSGAFANSCSNGKAQTAVGISEDGRWLFFVVNPHTSTLENMATMLKDDLDIRQAIKFDGGGSSQLWFGGKSSNNRVVKGDRQLSQYLAIFAGSGSGISVGEPTQPSPSPDDDLSWQEKLLNWWHNTKVYKQWEQIQEKYAEVQKFITDLQELSRNIQDPNWWLDQFNSLTSCGAALLPVLAAGIVWMRRRARR